MTALAEAPRWCTIPGLPAETMATAPPESRGVPRDEVRMLVADQDGLRHRRATDLPTELGPGDLLVVNRSDTLPAALPGTIDGARVRVHLSTLDPVRGDGYGAALANRRSRWVVEIRVDGPLGGLPSRADRTGAVVALPGGARLLVGGPHPGGTGRLWLAELVTPSPLLGWLRGYGDPVRYPYVARRWPLSAYRTTFADSPGSAEMPSAGRALTPALIERVRARGARVASIVLHCGVSSLESGDPPFAEWYDVPFVTAAAVARARRVVAVGTTVVRALESAAGRPASGWTDLVITPDTPLRTVDGLLTGWHEPEASHLLMLGAVAGCDLLADSYAEAARTGYRWHEFGDLHLLLPGRRGGRP